VDIGLTTADKFNDYGVRKLVGLISYITYWVADWYKVWEDVIIIRDITAISYHETDNKYNK